MRVSWPVCMYMYIHVHTSLLSTVIAREADTCTDCTGTCDTCDECSTIITSIPSGCTCMYDSRSKTRYCDVYRYDPLNNDVSSLMYNSSTILTTDVAMSNAISSTESIVATLSSNLITDFISILKTTQFPTISLTSTVTVLSGTESTTATTESPTTSLTVVEPTTATTESPTTSLTVILSTTIPTTAVIILLSIILISMITCAILGRRRKLHHDIPTDSNTDGNGNGNKALLLKYYYYIIGGQVSSEKCIRSDYYEVQLDTLYNTEPVYFTLDPTYTILDHDVQSDSPHYNVISTAYNTTPQYSTTDDSVVDSTINDSAIDSPQYSTIDDTHVSAVDTAPTPLYSTVVVKDGRKVTVTVGGEGSAGDH